MKFVYEERKLALYKIWYDFVILTLSNQLNVSSNEKGNLILEDFTYPELFVSCWIKRANGSIEERV